MNRNVFLLATHPNNPGKDVIHARGTGIKLRVVSLGEDPFSADSDEIQLYGNVDGKMFAFETIGITSDDVMDMVEAIHWYADYIDCPEMEIAPEDPRLDREIAM